MSDLAGVRILLVEDEAIIALTVEDMLDDLGAIVVASTPTLVQALAAVAAGGFDAAMLDVNLGGENSAPVAAALRERAVPFVVATGYGEGGCDPAHLGAPVLAKPYRIEQLRDALATVLGRS